MVIERFREGAAPEVYRRARDRGRMMPDGLEYVSRLGGPRVQDLLSADAYCGRVTLRCVDGRLEGSGRVRDRAGAYVSGGSPSHRSTVVTSPAGAAPRSVRASDARSRRGVTRRSVTSSAPTKAAREPSASPRPASASS